MRAWLIFLLFSLSVSAFGHAPSARVPSPNLTSDGQRVFGYDAENQLVSVERAGQWRVTYQYDAFGRKRVRQEFSWNGAWQLLSEKRYLYDGYRVIEERDAQGRRLASYTRGLDLSGTLEGAGGIGGLIARTDPQTGQSFYYHADAQGNVTALFDGAGNAVARYLYDPYGNLIASTGPLAESNLYRFSSKEYDPRTGLYDFGFRWYDPNLQRWLTQDPIGERGGINLFGFVGNDPVNRIDPFGLVESDPLALLANLSVLIDSAFGFLDWAYEKTGLDRLLGGPKPSEMAIALPAAAGLRSLAMANRVRCIAAKNGPVVIGETMTRVEQAASKIPGSKILNDMPDFRAMGMNPDQVTSAMMQYNRKWILEQMRSGRQIIDIGADVNRARPSIFYEMEQNMLKNYQKLHPEFNNVTRP